MAWLEQHPTSGRFKICFRFGGRQLKKTVKVTQRQQVEAILLRLEENVSLVERGRLQAPARADIASFLLTDGHLTQPIKAEAPPKPFTLGELRDLYVAAHSQGAMEANSLQTATMHLGHFVTSLGAAFAIKELTLDDLQHVANADQEVQHGAGQEEGPGRGLSRLRRLHLRHGTWEVGGVAVGAGDYWDNLDT
jgi:hypothetical protein